MSTEDEKAANIEADKSHYFSACRSAFCYGFERGIAHQRAQEDEAVKSFIEFANKFDDYTIHSRNKCESYNNCTCGLTKLRKDFKQAIETYNKVRGGG